MAVSPNPLTAREGRKMAENYPGKAARVLGILVERPGAKPRTWKDEKFVRLAANAREAREGAGAMTADHLIETVEGYKVGITEGLRASGRCQNCGRELTDPVSVAREIGPDCYAAGARAIGDMGAPKVTVSDELKRRGFDPAPEGTPRPTDPVGTSWPSLAAFYETSPEWRERSPEMDFGVWWTWPESREPWRVSVLAKTGEVIAVRQGTGGKRDDWVALLGRLEIVDEPGFPAEAVYAQAEHWLAGWPDFCSTPGSLAWVVKRLEIGGARKPDDPTGRPARITHIGRGLTGPMVPVEGLRGDRGRS